MTHETDLPEHKEQKQDTLPKPEYALIESAIEVLDLEANLAWETMNAAYESADDEGKHSIDKFQDDFAAATIEAKERGGATPSLSSFLESAEGLPDEFKSGVLAYEACSTKIESAEAELEHHAAEKALAVVEYAKGLEARLDYDKVVAAAFADDDRIEPFQEEVRISSINLLYDVSKFISLRKLLEGSTVPTYQQLRSIEHSLSRYDSDWKEQGLLKDEASERTETARVALDTDKITGIETHINDVNAIRKKYKKFDHPIRTKTYAVLDLTRSIKEAEEPATSIDEVYRRVEVVYNDELGAALNKRLVQKLSELPADEFEADVDSDGYAKLVEQARSIDLAEALKTIEVTGSMENLPFAYSEAELRLFLLTSIPPTALASVKRIQFRPMTKEEDQEDDTLGFLTWSKELGGSEIVISDVRLQKRYENIREFLGQHEGAEAIALLSAKNRMLQTITHEFGHALHEVLPVAALKRWEEQRAADPTNITAYVKDCHDKDHPHRYMEDFADTMAYFINHPQELTVTSPARFNAMQQIFQEFMPLYADVIQKLQELKIATDKMFRSNGGLSDEDAKRTYLSHETL